MPHRAGETSRCKIGATHCMEVILQGVKKLLVCGCPTAGFPATCPVPGSWHAKDTELRVITLDDCSLDSYWLDSS